MFGFGRKTVTKKTKGNACMSQGDMNTAENRKEVNKGMLSTTQPQELPCNMQNSLSCVLINTGSVL